MPFMHTAFVGLEVGTCEGYGVGAGTGRGVGREVGVILGKAVGIAVGTCVGCTLGGVVGIAVGMAVGPGVGDVVGIAVGLEVGTDVGAGDGGVEGTGDGNGVGISVGAGVGVKVSTETESGEASAMLARTRWSDAGESAAMRASAPLRYRRFPAATSWMVARKVPSEMASSSTDVMCDMMVSSVPSSYVSKRMRSSTVTCTTTVTPEPSA